MSTMTTIPSPATIARRVTKPVTPTTTERVAVEVPLEGKVRPGTKPVVVGEHDGVLKTKNLKSGMVVRAFLKGEPRGGERTIDRIKRLGDGSMYEVFFVGGNVPSAEYKAAYRWHAAELVGSDVTKHVPALVTYEEV